jgi:hypothetical protein
MHINFMRYSWNHIRTFLAVAQTGSLSATARALQITQPTVGRCIDLLEDALKMALFVRSREGMSLTQILNLSRTLPAGNSVYNSTAWLSCRCPYFTSTHGSVTAHMRD